MVDLITPRGGDEPAHHVFGPSTFRDAAASRAPYGIRKRENNYGAIMTNSRGPKKNREEKEGANDKKVSAS